jgi:hypothetical protein
VTRFAACFAAAGAVLLPMTIEAQDAHFGGFRCIAANRFSEACGATRSRDGRPLHRLRRR